MKRSHLIALLLLSGCYTTPDERVCTSNSLPDPVVTACDNEDDLDGDGVVDCDDPDIDGDGLRNGWDCSPLDPDSTVPHSGGRCDDPDDRGDGSLVVEAGDFEIWQPLFTTLRLNAIAGTTDISVVSGADFKAGDEILIISQQGDSAGTYEVAMVATATAASLTVEPGLLNDYDASDLVRVQRVPHYDDVRIDGTLTTEGWSPTAGGGVVMFRVCGDVTVAGAIDVDDLGFAGGEGVAGQDALPTTGESWIGPSIDPQTATDETEEYAVGARNGGGGGAPVGDVDALRDQNAGGAGGSLGTTGEYSYSSDGEKYAQPGEIYGTASLSTWFLGSGGGGGAPDREEDGISLENISGNGGAGGGVVILFARTSATVSGVISANGERGDDAVSQSGDVDGFPIGGEPGGGGGGSGGTLMLVSKAITVDSADSTAELSVRWGEGGWPATGGEVDESVLVRGGKGGYGYMRLDAETLLTPGTITVGADGPFQGDFDLWCWDSTALPERPCYTDDDEDGVVAWECGGADCDDADANIHPGAEEVKADSLDQDCDGQDLCDDATWFQGGLKTANCATGTGGGLAGLVFAIGAALGLRRRRN